MAEQELVDKKVEVKAEDKKPDVKVEEKKQVKTKEPEYTETQLRAMDQGWKPKTDFDGPEEMFIDAGEFIRRGELFGKIEQQRKEVSELRKTMRTMQEHHSKVKEAEFQRALDVLKKQKIAALKEGEPEQIVEIDEQMDQVRDALAESKAEGEREKVREQVKAEQPDPRFTSWVDRNRWYAQDGELKTFADSIGIAYTKSNPGIDPVEVLKYVEKRVKVAYPDKFRNPNRDKANAVEDGGGTRSGGTGSKKSVDDYEMTPEEEKVFSTLHRSDPKYWTKERYTADLKTKSYVRVAGS